jgi:membrane-associated phospholipid phosphatase
MSRAIRWWPPIALSAMLLLGWAVGTGSTAVDQPFAHDLDESRQPRWLLLFTDWRLLLPVIVACLVVALYRRRWRLALVVALSAPIAILLVDGLKLVFGRHRGHALAYPSGHTTTVVVVMGMVVLVVGARLWVVAIAITASILGALGMILCGYHYLTDTIGALLLGTALVCIAAQLARPRVTATGPPVASSR